MLLTLGECLGNARAAVRRYSEKYPRRNVPNYKTFLTTERRLRECGTLKPRNMDRGRERIVRTTQNEENVLDILEENPSISTRRVAVQTHMSHSVVWRIAKEHQLHPYHYRQVQDLSLNDINLRMQFCELILSRHNRIPTFLSRIIFTDEATFTKSGIFNMHNAHIWAEENPHARKITHYQHSFKINVWAATLGNMLLGYHILQGNLDGEMYHDFLSTKLFEFLENIPLARRRTLWYMHDGAPPHFSQQCRAWLNEHFRNRWIGRGNDAPIKWPPRSPDLNPLDFTIWGQMKDKVYAEPVDNVEQLHQRIEVAFSQLTEEHRLDRILFSVERRLHQCIRSDGGHFEE